MFRRRMHYLDKGDSNPIGGDHVARLGPGAVLPIGRADALDGPAVSS